MPNKIIIVGPVGHDREQLYWNNNPDTMWVEFKDATTFPRDVLSLPLPPGGSGFMELTSTGEYVTFYAPTPPEGVI